MRTSVRLLGCALLAVAGVVVAGSAGWGSGARAASSAVALQPPSQVVHMGENVTVDVAVSGVTDLAAWQVVIRYDPAVLSFAAYQPTGWLDSSGRHQICPSAIVTAQFGTVQLGCGSSNLTPDGVAGGDVVAHVTFTANATGTSNLELLQAQLANPNGDDCCGAAATFEGAVKVVEPGSSDTTDPPTPTPNPAKLTPTAIPGLNSPDDLRLPSGTRTAPGTRTTPSAGGGNASGGSGTGGSATGGTISGAVAGASNGGLFGGSSSGGQASGSAGAPGAPHAGTGTVRSEHSLLVRLGAGLLAVVGLVCLAVSGFERRRRVTKAE